MRKDCTHEELSADRVTNTQIICQEAHWFDVRLVDCSDKLCAYYILWLQVSSVLESVTTDISASRSHEKKS